MSTLFPPPVVRSDGIATRRWTAEEYLRLAELGFFDNQRVELIDGEIIQMSPIHNAHASVVSRLTKLLNSLDDEKYWVRVQATLQIGEDFPEPDIAVVPGPITGDGTFPTSALLVIEVSDSTLRFDQTKKMALYASAGIAEYWAANIPEKQVEVYRRPVSDAGQRFGYRYADVRQCRAGTVATPMFDGSVAIAVGRLFG